jgi:DNA-binding Lrp family transcriptional regulator
VEEEVRQLLAPQMVESWLVLPAIRTYKLRVRFRLTGGTVHASEAGGREAPAAPVPVELSAADRRLLGRLELGVPLTPHPWAEVAQHIGSTEDAVISRLGGLKEAGVIRRIAGVLRHRRIGVRANGMTCLQIPLERIDEAGAAAAACPEVSHCYHRPASREWPYRLYAMVHGETREGCEDLAAELARKTGAAGHRVLFSEKEYKKKRPRYFDDSLENR